MFIPYFSTNILNLLLVNEGPLSVTLTKLKQWVAKECLKDTTKDVFLVFKIGKTSSHFEHKSTRTRNNFLNKVLWNLDEFLSMGILRFPMDPSICLRTYSD